jgi:hypothetical protein
VAAVDRANATPKIVSVVLAGRILEMPFDSVLASMANQLASRSAIPPGLTYYDTFQLYKSDIEQYLLEMFAANPDYQVDLFDSSWVKQFFAWKSEKNKPFCKDIVVTFPDGSEWSLRAIDVATLRAEQLFDEKENVSPEEFLKERDRYLEDDESLLAWASTHLCWEDVSAYAEETRRPQPEMDYASAWQSAPKRIQPWDDGSYVLAWPCIVDDDDWGGTGDPNLSKIN